VKVETKMESPKSSVWFMYDQCVFLCEWWELCYCHRVSEKIFLPGHIQKRTPLDVLCAYLRESGCIRS